LFAQIGMTPSYLRASGRGMAAVQQTISYKRELVAGDIIEVRSGIVELRAKVLRLVHDMINVETGESAASCELTAVHLHSAARKSIPFEDNVQALAQKLMS
jgi:acyl-CoA thioester hydrolase